MSFAIRVSLPTARLPGEHQDQSGLSSPRQIQQLSWSVGCEFAGIPMRLRRAFERCPRQFESRDAVAPVYDYNLSVSGNIQTVRNTLH
jgi:hypothetical protein